MARKRDNRGMECVLIAVEPQQFRELQPGGVPAGGLVCEDPVQNLAF